MGKDGGRETPQRSGNYMCIGWIEGEQRASSTSKQARGRVGLGSPFLRNHGSILVLAFGLMFTDCAAFWSDEDGINGFEFERGRGIIYRLDADLS